MLCIKSYMVQLNVSYKGKTRSFKVEGDNEKKMYNLKIGDKIQAGSVVSDLKGYELKIVGGSDKAGFPMNSSVLGIQRKALLLNKGTTGYRGQSDRKGTRRRKLVAGNTIYEGTAQINCVVLKEGEKKFDEIFKSTKKQKDSEQEKK